MYDGVPDNRGSLLEPVGYIRLNIGTDLVLPFRGTLRPVFVNVVFFVYSRTTVFVSEAFPASTIEFSGLTVGDEVLR